MTWARELAARATSAVRWAGALGRRVQHAVDQTRIGRTLKRYGERNGGVLAGGIAYSSLTSIAAAVLLTATVASFVVGANERWRTAVEDFVRDAIPGIFPGEDTPGLIDPSTLKPTAVTGVVGVVALVLLVRTATAYLTSLRVGVRAMLGTARLAGLVGKAWDAVAFVALMAVILAGAVIQVAASSFAWTLVEWAGQDDASPAVVRVPAILAGYVADAGFVALVYVVLGRVRAPRREVLGAVLFSAAAIAVLQQLSTLLVASASRNVVLAPFAAVVVLLLFVTLVAQVLLYGAAWLGARIDQPDRGVPASLPPVSRRKRGGVTTTRAVGR